MTIKISTDVMAVLSGAETHGNALRLLGQLDRKLYVEVNKVIEAIGGKWNRKNAVHLFEEDAADLVDNVLLTGAYSRVKQDLGQFDTPPDLAAYVVDLAGINAGMSVLEPSFGIGRLVHAIALAGGQVRGYELDAKRYEAGRNLEAFSMGCHHANFLSVPAEPIFARVVMNPPFRRFSDVEHVLHALDFLRPGGLLVSIMSAAIRFRTDKRTASLRALIEARGGNIEDVAAKAFAAEGTAVNTCIVTIPN
jgi:predicted RNA methylase